MVLDDQYIHRDQHNNNNNFLIGAKTLTWKWES